MYRIYLLFSFLLLHNLSNAQILNNLKKKTLEAKKKTTTTDKPGNHGSDNLEPDDVPPFSEAIKPGKKSSYKILTIAGPGNSKSGEKENGRGFVNGNGRAAEFDNPIGIISDGSGNLLIADAGNYAIRKIDGALNVSTVAGTGFQGENDGEISEARFYYPVSLARMKNGDLIVADKNNNCIRKIADNKLTTISGNELNVRRIPHKDGQLSEALFNRPNGIAINNSGEIFICDEGNHCIRKIANGIVSTLAGNPEESGYADGQGKTAKFSRLYGLVIDADNNIYVADGNMIRKITPSGTVTTWAGAASQYDRKDGIGTMARFSSIRQMAICPSGNIYVTDNKFAGADINKTVICKITPDGNVVTIAEGLTEPEYLKALYKMYGENWRITTGHIALDGPVGEAYLSQIGGICVDSDENIYITDLQFHCVRKLSAK